MVSLEANKWASHSTMKVDRDRHRLVALQSTLVALSGYDTEAATTMEFGNPWGTDSTGWVLNEERLPYGSARSCAIKISPEEIMFTGGGYGNARGNTAAYNLNSNSFTILPDMIYERTDHSCALVRGENTSAGVLVAGGRIAYDETLSSTEFFDFATQAWIEVRATYLSP